MCTFTDTDKGDISPYDRCLSDTIAVWPGNVTLSHAEHLKNKVFHYLSVSCVLIIFLWVQAKDTKKDRRGKHYLWFWDCLLDSVIIRGARFWLSRSVVKVLHKTPCQAEWFHWSLNQRERVSGSHHFYISVLFCSQVLYIEGSDWPILQLWKSPNRPRCTAA